MNRSLLSKCKAYFQLFKTNVYWRFFFSRIGTHSVITGRSRIVGYRHIEIGENCWIGDNLRLEAVCSYAGIKYSPFLSIGNNVCINQNFHCTCAEKVSIGDGTSFTANCGVFDIIHPYNDINVNPREAVIKTDPVIIGKDCLVGMNSVILPGTQIGNHCVIGANSVVSGIFPDYCVIVGAPAKVIKKYDFISKDWIRVEK